MNKTTTIIVGLVVIVLAFYGGMKYGGAKAASAATTRGNFASGQFGGRSGMRGANGAGVANGQILSKDAQSITVQMRDGSSKLIFLSGSTAVMKAVAGNINDLATGEQVTVIGTPASDGNSITAQSIQIRPATTTLSR